LARYALIASAAALLAGCGGSQPPIGAPGAMPQSRSITGHADRGESWMLPEATSEDLIYVASDPPAVLSYNTGKLVGTVDAGGEGVCSDTAGDVFFVGSGVVEYSHGGTVPIATLNLPGYAPSASGCASDPTTGNLAVTYYTFGTAGSGENVAVFADAQGTPTVYQSGIDSQSCTYDNEGNLFADGYLGNGVGIAELPNGGSAFTAFPLEQQIGGNPRSILWDGKYLSVEGIAHSSVTFSRIKIVGSTATIVGTVRFRGKMVHTAAAWLFGKVLLIPYAASNVTRIGLWRYPKGGKPIQVFTHKDIGERLSYAEGLTVSVAPSR
jgi:hypothetical protein